VFFGVCGGLAEYCNFSAFWTRVLMVALFVCTGFWPVGVLYLVLAVLMKKEPRVRWAGVTPPPIPQRGAAAEEDGDLDVRIRRMEAKVAAKGYDWDRRLYNR